MVATDPQNKSSPDEIIISSTNTRRSVNEPKPEEFKWFPKDFVFELNLAYAARKGAIGLDLCEALFNFNMKHGFDNFKLTTRISNEKA